MVNKRQICCEIFIMVLERNRRYSLLLQAVARLKWHQKSLSQMAALCRSASRA